MTISALSALALGWSCALQPLALQTPALRRNGCQQPLALQTPPHRLDGRLTAISPVARVPRARSPVALEPNELIDQAVAISTFAPQPFWLLMIALPRARVTRALMEPLAPILGLSLVHFAVVVTAASQQDGTAPITIFFDVFDPAQNQLDGMERLFSFRNFVAEEWPYASSIASAPRARPRRRSPANRSARHEDPSPLPRPPPLQARAHLGPIRGPCHMAGRREPRLPDLAHGAGNHAHQFHRPSR